MWSLLSLPDLKYVQKTLNPYSITIGQSSDFNVKIKNNGSMGLKLNANSSIQFSSNDQLYSFNLIDDRIIKGNSEAELIFKSNNKPIILERSYYFPKILLDGEKDNKEKYSKILNIVSDSLNVDSPVNLSIVKGTLFPDTVAFNQDTQFSVEVVNTGSADALIDESNSYIKIVDGSTIYKSFLLGDSLVSGNSSKRLSFVGSNINSTFSNGTHQANFELIGLDRNKYSFSFTDSTSSDYLSIITAPNISYASGLKPEIIKPGENIFIELVVNNSGQAYVTLDTNTTLRFSYGDRIFSTNLSYPVFLDGGIKNKKLQFNGKIFEDSGTYGKFPIVLDLNGNYLNRVAFIQNDLIADSIYVWSGRGAEILSIHYIDGSIAGIPDGDINKGDLIKIKFDRQMNLEPIALYDVKEAFTLISKGDRFSRNNSEVLKTFDMLNYDGTDKDSVVFIELGDNPLLSNSGATKRLYNNSSQKTDIKTSYDPSLIIINTNIKENIIVGTDGSDAGFPMNKANLDSQLIKINNVDSSMSFYTKFSVLAYDTIPPVMLNVYPNWNLEKNVSSMTPFKAFISGRNYIYKDHLASYLNEVIINKDSIDFFIENHERLFSALSEINNINPGKIKELRKELDSYNIMINDNDSPILINPFKKMFSPIIGPIKYNFSTVSVLPDTFYSLEGPLTNFERSSEDYIISDNTIPSYNLEIRNNKDFADKTFSWLHIPTAEQSYVYVDSFAVSKQRGSRSVESYHVWSAPNPFIKSRSEKIEIEYELSDNVENIELILVDSAGRLVKKWKNTELNSSRGLHRVNNGWDGTNMNQDKISSGVYLLYLKIDNTLKSSWVIAYKS